LLLQYEVTKAEAPGDAGGPELEGRASGETSSLLLGALLGEGNDSFGYGRNVYSHSQRPVPRGFPLLKRCEWLVGK